jgi:hypothetical protein
VAGVELFSLEEQPEPAALAVVVMELMALALLEQQIQAAAGVVENQLLAVQVDLASLLSKLTNKDIHAKQGLSILWY